MYILQYDFNLFSYIIQYESTEREQTLYLLYNIKKSRFFGDFQEKSISLHRNR